MNTLDIYRAQPRDTTIRLYGRDAFEGMKKAGQLASRALDMLAEHVKPGVTTERAVGRPTLGILVGVPRPRGVR